MEGCSPWIKGGGTGGRELYLAKALCPEAGGAGTNRSGVTVAGASKPKATVTATAVCREPWLPNVVKCSGSGTAHIILAVTDDGSPRLTSYRRIILTVRAAAPQ